MSAAAALERARVHEPPSGTELLRHYLRDLVYGVGWLIAGLTQVLPSLRGSAPGRAHAILCAD
jgi:hypothetical protein